MKKMEDEMNRFRTQLLDREREFFDGGAGGNTLTSRSEQHNKTSSSHSTTTDNDGGTGHKSELTTWLDGLNSPLVQDTEGGKVLKLRFDVTQYAPEEIVVKTVDNRLQVSLPSLNCITFSFSLSISLSIYLFLCLSFLFFSM